MANQSNLHHTFDEELAAELKSIELSVLVHHFQYWIKHNKRTNRNKHEGRTWMYQSLEDMSAHFSYWSKTQVERLVRKLVDKDILIKGNFNKSPYDRTVWYAFKDESRFVFLYKDKNIDSSYEIKEKFSISRNREMEISKSRNEDLGIEKCIIGKDTKTDIKKESKEKENVSQKNPTISETSFRPPLFLFEKLKKRDAKRKTPNLSEWAIHIERLIKIDGRDEKEIKEMIEWACDHKYWKGVIHSTESLRKNFEEMVIEKSAWEDRKNKKTPKEIETEKKVETIQENKQWVKENNLKATKRITLQDGFVLVQDGEVGYTIEFADEKFKEKLQNAYSKLI